MKAFLAILIAAGALAACSSHVQTTSGADYLSRTKAPPATRETVTTYHDLGDGKRMAETVEILSTDDLVREAAAIEPILTLPARIGLARIENGRLTVIPPVEAQVWEATAARFPGLGTAVPVDPFLAELTSRSVIPEDGRRVRGDVGDIISVIRLGAARQHLDAVLVYEIGTVAGGGDIDGLGPIRVLGGVQLRGAAVGHEGLVRALLLDVRNGYPYATMSASADLDGSAPDFWAEDADDKAYAEATRRIVTALSVEVDQVFSKIIEAASTRLASK